MLREVISENSDAFPNLGELLELQAVVGTVPGTVFLKRAVHMFE